MVKIDGVIQVPINFNNIRMCIEDSLQQLFINVANCTDTNGLLLDIDDGKVKDTILEILKNLNSPW